MGGANDTAVALELRLLGPIQVKRRGAAASLPRSKKTRALLAYLAMTRRDHTRQRLCELFWDVTDDPRGALRWSLSRLRKVVDDDVRRIEADRERVAFVANDALVDAVELGAVAGRDLGGLELERLESLAAMARGEFLEGLELPDFYEFQAWCVAQREHLREARCAVLAELVERLRRDPRRALTYARARVSADSLSVPARAELLELLVRAGKSEEAVQQLDMSCRMLREIGAPGERELRDAWTRIEGGAQVSAPVAPASIVRAPAAAPAAGRPPVVPAAADPSFVGRDAERERLLALLDDARARGSQRVVLITAEPGAGKSTVAEWLVARAVDTGAAVLASRAYEAESTRPYGPWVDALRTELSELLEPGADGQAPANRDALFAAVADALVTRAAQHGSAVLVLDDIQWLDADSVELLHFVVRTNRQRPIVVVLLARTGELADNEHALRALRSLRRETRIDEVELAPMSRDDVAALIASYHGADAGALYDACAGNPLYALELARAAAAGVDETPRSLVELIRERIDRLHPSAADVLRWGAVLGHTVHLPRLEALCTADAEELVVALEQLEQHSLLRGISGDLYTFAHDVVREAVYGELSHPRRRLMHQQVARLLDTDSASADVATQIAHHATLAGDAARAVRACIVAGLQSLRAFANGDAEALAKRGLRLVDQLDDDARVSATLELLHVQYTARAPDPGQAAELLRPLIEQALDAELTTAARLGFQMLSYLRWETGSMIAAHDNIMRAERVSRSAEPAERTIALSQAAKCLLLLERDMPLAESFLLEATALSERTGDSPSAMRFALGMMHEHRGELDAAVACYDEAQRLGRRQGDPLAEFGALERWSMLELDRGSHARALELAGELARLAGRVRTGAEAASGRALYELARRCCGHPPDDDTLDTALAELRTADSKYRLAYVLARLGRLDLERDDSAGAAERATIALELATAIDRPSEIAVARSVLARCAHVDGDAAGVADQVDALEALRERDLSAAARDALEATVAGLPR